VLFGIGAIICGAAKDFTTMLCGRSIQGVGCGGIIALTEILVTDLVPLRQRGKWFALINVIWAIGSVSGPIVGRTVFVGNNLANQSILGRRCSRPPKDLAVDLLSELAYRCHWDRRSYLLS